MMSTMHGKPCRNEWDIVDEMEEWKVNFRKVHIDYIQEYIDLIEQFDYNADLTPKSAQASVQNVDVFGSVSEPPSMDSELSLQAPMVSVLGSAAKTVIESTILKDGDDNVLRK